MATIFDILLNQHLESSKNQYCKRYGNCPNKNESKRSIDFLPTLDVYDSNDSLIVQVELAGVDKQDIDVQIKESVLTIQGEKKPLSSSSISSTTNPSSPTSSSTAATTTNSAVTAPSTNESTDLPSIEEFEEGDPTIKKSSSTSTSKPNIESSPTTTNETIRKKYIVERSSGYFKRYVDLTKILYSLDLSSISTDYTNGLLTITIKKKPDYPNTIKININ